MHEHSFSIYSKERENNDKWQRKKRKKRVRKWQKANGKSFDLHIDKMLLLLFSLFIISMHDEDPIDNDFHTSQLNWSWSDRHESVYVSDNLIQSQSLIESTRVSMKIRSIDSRQFWTESSSSFPHDTLGKIKEISSSSPSSERKAKSEYFSTLIVYLTDSTHCRFASSCRLNVSFVSSDWIQQATFVLNDHRFYK